MDGPLLALGDIALDPDLPDSPVLDPDAPFCPNEDLDACACNDAESRDVLFGAWRSPLFDSRRDSEEFSAYVAISNTPYPIQSLGGSHVADMM